ncbi:MAG: hypothetical protein O2923_04105 [Verrucomicrobia bacterium]|nr:hypothetical protein [Verrucomicrobiota bacterium]MDA1086340.1 hypothetical protein [Verrucomicrobiota bacterium]
MQRNTPYRLLVAAAAIIIAHAGDAQIALEMTTKHREYLQYESMPATLTLQNQSGLDIEFGRYDNEANLRLNVEFDRGQIEERIVDTREVLETTVRPGESARFTVDLSRLFDLRTPRRYLFSAAVVWRSRDYPSKPRFVSVVNGFKIAGERRGLPMSPETVREYELRYQSRSETEHLFLTINGETEDVCFGVFDLGPLIRVYEPIMKFDHVGNVRVIHHSGRGVNTHNYLISDEKGVRHLEALFKTLEDIEITGDGLKDKAPPGFELDR